MIKKNHELQLKKNLTIKSTYGRKVTQSSQYLPLEKTTVVWHSIPL